MGSIQEYKLCKCGYQEMVSDYYYKSEELHEFCEVCGYHHSVSITNRPKDGKYPDGWKPEYKEEEGTTGFVAKIFNKDGKGYTVACIEKKSVRGIIEQLTKDAEIIKFGITFKDNLGHYQTQIYK
jgi:hypothetical protein